MLLVRKFFFALIFFLFRRCLDISTKDMPINGEIKAKEVRLVGPEGEALGIFPLKDALDLAYDKDMDLVLMAPTAQPPVCRIMDYGKFCFERNKKEKEARKKQQVVEVKEIQLSCRIDTHDFQTKVNHAIKFLNAGNKVRVVVKFKGREMTHLDIGRDVLTKFENAMEGVGQIDKKPMLEGRFMSMMVVPLKK